MEPTDLLKNKRILVVEDEYWIAQEISETFRTAARRSLGLFRASMRR